MTWLILTCLTSLIAQTIATDDTLDVQVNISDVSPSVGYAEELWHHGGVPARERSLLGRRSHRQMLGGKKKDDDYYYEEVDDFSYEDDFCKVDEMTPAVVEEDTEDQDGLDIERICERAGEVEDTTGTTDASQSFSFEVEGVMSAQKSAAARIHLCWKEHKDTEKAKHAKAKAKYKAELKNLKAWYKPRKSSVKDFYKAEKRKAKDAKKIEQR
jgi:hypothetical protein